MSRILLAASAGLAALGLAACETTRSINPFASTSPNRTHCRAALDHLVGRETERTRISVEDDTETRRDAATAVTIVYVQGESRRLFTCLYDPDRPGNLVGGSYRGEPLNRAQIDDINATLARR